MSDERRTDPHHLPLLRRRLRRARRRREPTAASTIKGDPDHPANFGRLCSKGTRARRDARRSTIACCTRRSTAQRASWDEALDLVAARFSRDDRRSMARTASRFYVSGQLLTEDYYVANKLMKGFIGSANIDTNSRLCMASSVAGHKRAFGADTVPGMLRGSRAGRSRRARRLQPRLVPSGAVSSACWRRARQRGTKIVVIDPRRTATCGDRRSASCRSRRIAMSRCSTGCSRISSAAGAIDRDYIAAHTSGLRRRARGRRARCRSTRSPHRPACRSRRLAQFYELFARHRAGRHGLQPGRQPVRRRHRQGQRHHQLPSGDRPHRQARHGAVLGHRPAERHGRARGRRARQHARRAHGASRIPQHREHRAALLAVAAHRRQARPQGRRHVPRRRRRPHQGALDHGDQPGRTACRMPIACATALRGLPVRRRLRRRCATPTRPRSRMCCCRPPPGARRTARSPIPSGASRASARSCRARARRGPTGGSSPRSPSAWASPTASTGRHRARSSPSTRRCPAAENDGTRDFDISAHAAITAEAYDALRAVPVAAAARRSARRDAVLRRRRVSSRPIAGRGSCRRRSRAPPRARRDRVTRSCSTPAASATSGTR